MRILFLFIFLLVINSTFAQSSTKSFWQLSCPEKWWVIGHPFVANKARKLTTEALRVTEEMKTDTTLDGDADGGQVDAFRHSFWMALLSQKIKMRKAISLGKAHEKGNYKMFKKGKTDEEKVLPDSVSGAMDLFNNETGANIGNQSRELNQDSLKILIRTYIIEGKMKIISKNKQGQFLDCSGEIIDLGNYINTWGIPKCLIQSGSKH